MATYTSRIEITDGNIVAWIDRDGYQVLRQPHHPSSYNNEPWTDEASAQAWADETIVQLEANDVAQASQQEEQKALIEQAKADSVKIAEIHDWLAALKDKLN
jgi:hypothetical protein